MAAYTTPQMVIVVYLVVLKSTKKINTYHASCDKKSNNLNMVCFLKFI